MSPQPQLQLHKVLHIVYSQRRPPSVFLPTYPSLNPWKPPPVLHFQNCVVTQVTQKESYRMKSLGLPFLTQRDSLPCVHSFFLPVTGWYYKALMSHSLSSVQFSRSVMSDSLQPRGLQHVRLPCPSSTPRACSNSCPLNRWRHPTISSSVISFSCIQSFPASRSFPVSQFFTSGSQTIGASASATVPPMHTQDWSLLWWTG